LSGSRLRRAEEERADTLFRLRATSTNRASEASTSPSGELWDEVGGIQGAIRARDVRAADLQEKPTKRVVARAGYVKGGFVGFDEDGGFRRTSQRAERAIR
jgi:hypothetical protein